MSDEVSDLMTPAQFGARIRKSRDWVLRNYRVERIPHHQIDRSILFSEQDLADYLDRSRVAPAPRTSRKRLP
ncbi:hypothetical protein ACH436_12475 [Isoptericola sp. NPDC019693]|uniref:hypothetical protein n=1 Tax=Isoptericola sp. NPDC019693 TaxID=3364009 RepID=UPI0037BB3A14